MKSIIAFIFLIHAFTGFSQDSLHEVELTHYIINNHAFEQALDNFLDSEKVHSYYRNDLPIWVCIVKKDPHRKSVYRLLSIASVLDTSALLSTSYGYTYYRTHLVCLSSDTLSEIFSKTDERKKFTYIDYSKSQPLRYSATDGDPRSQWGYKYYKKKFLVINKKRGIN